MPEAVVSRPALLPELGPDQWPDEVPVLIAGGGPAGLSAAVLLAQHGVEMLLVERRGFEARFPRAHLLNVRTMEIFAEMGVADDIYALAPPDDRWRKVVWYTSVTGPTPLHGLKIGEVPAWAGGADAERYAAASPRKFSNLPQLRLDPLLWRHAHASCPGRIRGFHELTHIEQHEPGGVTATILDRNSGAVRRVRARYLIAADGGRVSANLLGVDCEGPRAIRTVVSCHVSTDMSAWSEPDALLAHFIHPRGRGRNVGGLQSLGPGRFGRASAEWAVAASGLSADPSALDDDAVLERAIQTLGLPPGHPVTLHAVSRWQYEGVVARRFRARLSVPGRRRRAPAPSHGRPGPQLRGTGRPQPGLEARRRTARPGQRRAAGQLRDRAAPDRRVLYRARAGERGPPRADRRCTGPAAGNDRGGGLEGDRSVRQRRRGRRRAPRGRRGGGSRERQRLQPAQRRGWLLLPGGRADSGRHAPAGRPRLADHLPADDAAWASSAARLAASR